MQWRRVVVKETCSLLLLVNISKMRVQNEEQRFVRLGQTVVITDLVIGNNGDQWLVSQALHTTYEFIKRADT